MTLDHHEPSALEALHTFIRLSGMEGLSKAVHHQREAPSEQSTPKKCRSKIHEDIGAPCGLSPLPQITHPTLDHKD